MGNPDELKVHAIGDVAYKSDDKAVGGELVLLGNVRSKEAIPIFGKSKAI